MLSFPAVGEGVMRAKEEAESARKKEEENNKIDHANDDIFYKYSDSQVMARSQSQMPQNPVNAAA